MNIQIATLALFIVFIAGAYSQANGHDNTTTTTNTSATVEVHGAHHRKGPIWEGKRRHGGKKAALAAVHHKKDDDKDKDKDDSDSDSDSAEKKDHEHKGVQHGHHAKHHHGDAVVKLDLHPIVDLIKEQLHESEERILAAIAHHPGHEKKS